MESCGELLPGLSLDSVLKKANELERILRDCKITAAREENSTSSSQEGRGNVNGHLDLPSPDSAADGDTTGLTTHWRHLSTYIVGLEKEILHYKQLVDGKWPVAPAHALRRGPASARAPQTPMQPLPHQPGLGNVSSCTRETTDDEYWTKLLESKWSMSVNILILVRLLNRNFYLFFSYHL